MARRNRNKKKGGKKPSKSPQQSSPQQSSQLKLLGNNFKVFITMDSDWHIGSGGGIPGSIDSLVQRDESGIPGISAKTLTGMWRDACESVALGLDGGEEGVWPQYVVFLFGDQPALNEDSAIINSPIGAALNIRPARLHPDLRDAILHRPDTVKQALIRAMTMSKMGISIDPVTGCAVEKFLRQEEMVRAGTYLTCDCQLQLAGLSEERQKAACALLIAGAIYLEKLGGKRRRGAGKCRVDLAGVKDANEWLDWIASHLQPPSPFQSADRSTSDRFTIEIASKDRHWYTVPLTITAQLPVIIKARTVGNIVETLDYIPGNRLLPIVARKLSKLGVNIVAAISQQQLIVTNATVEVGRRSGRPVPLALFYEKMSGGFDKGQVYNKLRETPSEDKQLKGYRQGYVGQLERQNPQLPDYATVNTVIQTHNTIDDASQRPTEEIGGVYSYQAIATGTVLQAELRLRADLVAALESKLHWWQKLECQENIGTSKKDDYGLVKIVPSEPQKIEVDKIITPSDKEDRLIVWLLSDVLIRDRQLRPSICVIDLQQNLTEAIERNLPEGQQVNLTLNSIYLRQRRTESWQRRWCLPRPSLTGLMAGSCIEFGITTNADLTRLNLQLEHLSIVGIGERTVEGYGQVSFNDPLLNQKISDLTRTKNNVTNTSSKTIAKITSAQNSFAYARLIETQAWRSAIATAAKALASNSSDRERLLGIKVAEGQSYPSMSQLGNLRANIANLREPQDIELVENWLNSTAEKRAKKWEQTSDGLNKIRALITSDRLIWSKLANYTDIPLADLTLTEYAEAYLSESEWSEVRKTAIATNKQNSNSLRLVLWAEAIRTVIYECIRAHKREVE